MKDNKALKYLTLITGVLTLLLGVYTLVRPMRTFLAIGLNCPLCQGHFELV